MAWIPMALSSVNHHISQALVEARRSGKPWQPAKFDESLGPDDAYAVQAAVAETLGWFKGRPQAWKVGALPMHNAAPLPEVLISPAVWPLAQQNSVLVEAELAFRFTRTPDNAQDMLGCLGTVCVAIEIVSTRLVDGLTAPPVWKLLDQGLHAGLVIGAELPFAAADQTNPLWSKQHCQIKINGELAAQSVGTHPTGDPLSALPWLFEHAARYTGGLRAGDLVTTGAWLVQTVYAGDTVDVAFEGFGAVHLAMSTA
jgi:2-keto-4-pentenoate hydratase